jgi:hypothetical protein
MGVRKDTIYWVSASSEAKIMDVDRWIGGYRSGK